MGAKNFPEVVLVPKIHVNCAFKYVTDSCVFQ